MQVSITRRFEKDVEKELDKKLQLELAGVIEQLQKAGDLTDIPNVKKLKGYKTAYRIRMGDYRIGFLYENEKITLSRVMNRKEIYRYFP